jgi:uncharacterized protein
MQEEQKDRFQTDYPSEWEYRIIGEDEAALKVAAFEILGDRKFEFAPANSSTTGKYVSFSVKIFVESEASRNKIYAVFAKHPAVKYVL